MSFESNLCRRFNPSFCPLLCPQPLEMNLVELAQHNFSDAPRHQPPLRGKRQQNKIAPWAAAVALMRRRRRRNRDRRPKLWHLLILFSCGVEARPRCLLLRLSCFCLFGGMDVRVEDSHGYFSDFVTFSICLLVQFAPLSSTWRKIHRSFIILLVWL